MESNEPLSQLLRLLADIGRVRILWLLSQAELAVHELQLILDWGQSRLSTQIGLLREADLLRLRREGKSSYYSLASPDETTPSGRILREVLESWSEGYGREDRPRLRQVLETRAEASRRRFAGDPSYLGEESVPGRTWEIVARGLFLLAPPGTLLDLGAGDGILGTLAAAAGHAVTLLDWSEEQLDRARERAAREGVPVACVRADFHATGLPEASFERVLLSHALHHAPEPLSLLAEAHRLLRPGGTLWVLDLLDHAEEWMKAEQGDIWLGFPPERLEALLQEAGFVAVRTLLPGTDARHQRLSGLCAAATRPR